MPIQIPGSVAASSPFASKYNVIDRAKRTILGADAIKRIACASPRTGLFHLDMMVEYGEASQVFTAPRVELTSNSITGRYA